MSRRTIPGILVAIMGMVLLAYPGVARAMQLNNVRANVRTDASVPSRARVSASIPGETVPLASLLGGILFMSGMGVAAISIERPIPAQKRDEDAQD